jgi:hypothetical protein
MSYKIRNVFLYVSQLFILKFQPLDQTLDQGWAKGQLHLKFFVKICRSLNPGKKDLDFSNFAVGTLRGHGLCGALKKIFQWLKARPEGQKEPFCPLLIEGS